MKSEAVSFPAVTLCNFRNLHFDEINGIFEFFQSGEFILPENGTFMNEYMTLASKVAGIRFSEIYDSDPEVQLAVQVNRVLFTLWRRNPTGKLHNIPYFLPTVRRRSHEFGAP